MADRMTNGKKPTDTVPDEDPYPVQMDDPLPAAGDPGGAHAKGYSADPRPEAPAPEEGPVPLAPAPAATSQVRQHERDADVRPTGRDDPGYSVNDRLMGSDR